MPGTLATDQLDAAIELRLIGRPMARGRRLLGVEYERLILHRDSLASAPLSFCRDLMRRLVELFEAEPVVEDSVLKGIRADGFELSMEPGGQLEVAAPPHPNLGEIDAILARVSSAIETALNDTDYRLVCLGHAPVTPAAELGLLPRERYRIMDASMPRRGPLTRNMMRATAGFQLTYDLTDAEDAGRKLALLFRLSPVLLALTANSRRAAGRDTGYASYRHKVWLETDADRTGVPEGCLHPETAIAGYIAYARRAHALFLSRGGRLVAAPEKTLEQLVAEGQVSDTDLDLHLSTLFPFVRLRNYIEVRCFDSVPWSHARSVLALVSGLVYCDKATGSAEALSEKLVPRDREGLSRLHLDAARSALDAHTPGGRVSLRELALELIGYSAATLGGPRCDWARADDLDAVRELAADD